MAKKPRMYLSRKERQELKDAAVRLKNLSGIDIVDVSTKKVIGDEVEVTIAARLTVYMVRKLPIDVDDIERRIRRYYLLPCPEIGDFIYCLGSARLLTVVSINNSEHWFACEDSDGKPSGKYQFGDMGITWRKA